MFKKQSSSLLKVSEVESLGQVQFVKHKMAKQLKITVRPFKPIRVTVPYRISFSLAEKFFTENKDWVEKTAVKMRGYERDQMETASKSAQIDPVVARRSILHALNSLSKIYDLKFNKVHIRNQKTRWGSCSWDNNISLNAYIAVLPRPLMKYVILHELVHTKVKNHGPRFWGRLEKILPNARQLDKELRNYSLPSF